MKKQKRKYDEINYWESMADSMVALLLCILLIMLLLVLYMVRISDDRYIDFEEGNSYAQFDNTDDGDVNHIYGNLDDGADEEGEDDNDADSYGGGGGGGNDGEGKDDYKFEDPDPGAGSGNGNDKAAVYVEVVDGETGRTVKKSGLEFELYGSNSALQVLSTYYPQKIDYKKYTTDEAGTFYLPEKLSLTSYYLHGISVLAGYDTTDNTEFTIDEARDWDDPYVVTVSLFPSKNIIRMKLSDRDSGETVRNAAFDVVAAEHIITEDGTTRYKEGDIVDTIVVDNEGYGESKELYLGNYLLRQSRVPEYYAKNTEDVAVEVKNKTDAASNQTTEVMEEKTSIKVTVVDALYNTTPISGAEFTLSKDDGTVVEKVKTDEKGRFTVTDLQKNITYHIQQISAVSDYKMDDAEHLFTVNGEGLIDGEEEADLLVKNRMIRISVGVKDKIFKGQVSDVNVAIHDASGNAVKTWNTTGLEQTIEGLAPGKYIVTFDGKEDQEQTIVVEDKTELQEFQFERWTTADIAAIVATTLILIGVIAITIFSMKRIRQKKTESKE